MNSDRELMQMALDALKGAEIHDPEAVQDTIKALRDRLAQPDIEVKASVHIEEELRRLHEENKALRDRLAQEDALDRMVAENERLKLYNDRLAQPEYDQTALELCDVCGWKAVVPDECCLNCKRLAQPEMIPITNGGVATLTPLSEFLNGQPEPEPVALRVVRGEICYKSDEDDQAYGMWCPVNYDSQHGFPDGTNFYTAPVHAIDISQERVDETAKSEHEQAQELRELAGRFSEGWHEGIKIDASDIVLLNEAASTIEFYTAPPKRKWVGLTNDEWVKELGQIREQVTGDVFGGFYRAIEAKLKEKNT